MSGAFRVEGAGRIDRTCPLSFTFNGRAYQGWRGDTLASALLANGVGLVARSFKFHRPRGIFTAGSEEPSALVQLEEGAWSEPNARATMIELYEGLTARSQNCWPSVAFDLGSVSGAFAPLLVAGFYYKTFMWPRAWWKSVYEKLIRHAAGMGRAPALPDPDRYAGRFAHCDVMVAGGGPAGLAAALAAGRAGARVVIADEQAELGGRLLCEPGEIDGRPAPDWVAGARAELAAMAEVTVLARTTVCGFHDHGYLTALERVTNHLGPRGDDRLPRERFWRIRARQVVIAAGAIERPVVFAGNDRPGTMLAGAVRTYLNRFGVLAGRKIAVFTNNDSAYGTALDLCAAGAAVQVVDMRTDAHGALAAQTERARIPIHRGHAVVATRGLKALRGCTIAALNADGSAVCGPSRSLRCDTIAVSGGWNPTVSLWTQAGGTLVWDEAGACFRPGTCAEPARAAGACNGAFGLAECLVQGARAGALAARDAGFGDGAVEAPRAPVEAQGPLRALFAVPARRGVVSGGPHFVDLQNDVTVADIELAAREGYVSVEHLKRYTTTGMGTDQGKTSNVNALAVLAGLCGVPIGELGVTTFRPPYTPVTFGAIVGQGRGELFEARRKPPMHPWHARHGAVVAPAGGWRRPWAYPTAGETPAEAVQRECAAVRRSAGLFDASTLGKIDVQGRDAAVLLERVYTNRWSDLAIGRCRYGLMLDDQGFVMDDGVSTRVGADHFHLTTTTGGGARVAQWLETWRQTEWPELDVYLTDVTEQWAVAVLCGPRGARRARGTDGDRSRPRALPLHVVSGRGGRRRAGASVPDRVLGRALLRDQRTRALRAAPVGHARRAGCALRALPLRDRGAARAQGRARVHRGGAGDRRHGDAGGPRPRGAGRAGQGGLHREALARAQGARPCRAARARGVAAGGPAPRAPAGSASGRDPEGPSADEDDRARDLELHEPRPGPVHRARPGRERGAGASARRSTPARAEAAWSRSRCTRRRSSIPRGERARG